MRKLRILNIFNEYWQRLAKKIHDSSSSLLQRYSLSAVSDSLLFSTKQNKTFLSRLTRRRFASSPLSWQIPDSQDLVLSYTFSLANAATTSPPPSVPSPLSPPISSPSPTPSPTPNLSSNLTPSPPSSALHATTLPPSSYSPCSNAVPSSH